MKGTVYLIHFSRPIGNTSNRRAMAQHYIGWTQNEPQRLHDHDTTVDGARIMQAVVAAGIGWRVVRRWTNKNRKFERKLKDRKKARDLCPECAGLFTVEDSNAQEENIER